MEPVNTDAKSDASEGGPWMVTLVQAQLDEMAAACNQLHRMKRKIEFIVPVTVSTPEAWSARPTSHIAIFSMSQI